MTPIESVEVHFEKVELHLKAGEMIMEVISKRMGLFLEEEQEDDLDLHSRLMRRRMLRMMGSGRSEMDLVGASSASNTAAMISSSSSPYVPPSSLSSSSTSSTKVVKTLVVWVGSRTDLKTCNPRSPKVNHFLIHRRWDLKNVVRRPNCITVPGFYIKLKAEETFELSYHRGGGEHDDDNDERRWHQRHHHGYVRRRKSNNPRLVVNVRVRKCDIIFDSAIIVSNLNDIRYLITEFSKATATTTSPTAERTGADPPASSSYYYPGGGPGRTKSPNQPYGDSSGGGSTTATTGISATEYKIKAVDHFYFKPKYQGGGGLMEVNLFNVLDRIRYVTGMDLGLDTSDAKELIVPIIYNNGVIVIGQVIEASRGVLNLLEANLR